MIPESLKNPSFFYNKRTRYITILYTTSTLGFVNWQIGTISFLLASFLFYRKRCLLPYEKNWLNKVKNAYKNLEDENAINIATKEPILISEAARIRAKILRTTLLAKTNKHIEAHKEFAYLKNLCLTPEEEALIDCLEARLNRTFGDFVSFKEKTDSWGIEDSIKCKRKSSLKIVSLMDSGNYQQAKKIAKKRLTLAEENSEKVEIYCNLAVIEGRLGNKNQKLSHLKQSYQIWKLCPNPRSIYDLIHNLTIDLLRSDQKEMALEVFSFSRNVINKENIQQRILWNNYCLEISRESNNSELFNETCADFENILQSENLNAYEKIALFIKNIRIIKNGPNYEYDITPLIEKALALIEKTRAFEQVHALFEIKALFSLCSHENIKLNDLQKICDDMIIDREETIEAHLAELPRNLAYQRLAWQKYKEDLIEIKICRSEFSPRKTISDFMNTKKETASIAEEYLGSQLSADQNRQLCSAFIRLTGGAKDRYRNLIYQDNLHLIDTSIEKIKTAAIQDPLSIENSLALATFYYQIYGKLEDSALWLQKFENTPKNLNHHAKWFREDYEALKRILNERSLL